MSSMILTAISLAIGGILTLNILKVDKNGKIFLICNFIFTIFLWMGKGFNLGLVFLICSIIMWLLAGMFSTSKNGVSAETLQKAFDEREAARARANPRLAMIDTINMNIRNNSPSPTTFFSQRSDDYEVTNSRIKTELDIRSGRQENGTNGIWLK